MKIKKLNEAFNVDTVQKRIARHNEFDNGHVLHNYEKMTSAEAEEKARLASLENPDDIYYVSYDDIMNPSSDIKWKNGKQVTEDYMPDDNDYDRVDRNGTDEELEIAAITYMYGVTWDTAKQYATELSQEEKEDAIKYYELRGLPANIRTKELAKFRAARTEMQEAISNELQTISDVVDTIKSEFNVELIRSEQSNKKHGLVLTFVVPDFNTDSDAIRSRLRELFSSVKVTMYGPGSSMLMNDAPEGEGIIEALVPLNNAKLIEQLKADGEDGWGDEIEEVLGEVFDKMQGIQYEVNNCVRGSYGVDGDKVENLVSELEEVQDMLNDKIWYLKHQSDELNETFNDNWTQRFSGMNVFTNGKYQIKSVVLANGQDGWELGRWNDSGRYNRIDVFTNIDKAKQKAYDLQYPLGETLNEELWDKSRVTDLVTYYLDRGNTPINTLGNLIKSQMEKEGSKLPYNVTDFYDQLYMAVDRYNAQFEESLKEGVQAVKSENLTEAKVFGHNIIHVGDDLVSKSGHKIHIDDIVATLSPFEKNAIVTFYYTYEMTNGETGSSQCSTFDLQNMLNESQSKLKEGLAEDAMTASRYLDFEIPEICKGVLDLIEHFPTHKLTYINKLCRDFYAKMESLIHSYTMEGDNYDESLTEDIDTEIKASPEEGPKFGLSSLLNDAIQEEFKTIDTYNSLAVTARDEGFEDIAVVVDEINTEENKHVGQLQALLKTIAPNAAAIDEGDIETGRQLNVTESFDDEDFDLATEFGISDDDDISEAEMQEALAEIKKLKEGINNSTDIPNNTNDVNINDIEEEVVDMREAWEDIYDSFKKIEVDLKGDGEAITATIDKLYQDNKGNPDFKKAYDKWASGN